MLETTVDEINEAFAAAKNSNAAIKTFLKKEVKAGSPVERFAKNFKAAVATGKPATLRAFIENSFPQQERCFLVCARYAHAEAIASIVEQIFDKHADEFNATYEKVEAGIEIKDKSKFAAIVKSVSSMLDAGLKAASLPPSNFLKNAVLLCVFDDEVLKEVFSRLK